MSLIGLWAVVFFSAFAAFVVVSTLIAVRGTGEIRELFRHLEVGRDADGRGRPPEGR